MNRILVSSLKWLISAIIAAMSIPIVMVASVFLLGAVGVVLQFLWELVGSPNIDLSGAGHVFGTALMILLFVAFVHTIKARIFG